MIFSLYKTWISVLLYKTKPSEIAKNTGLGRGLKHLATAAVIIGFLNGILQYLLLSEKQEIAIAQTFGIIDIAKATILAPVAYVIEALLFGAVLWALAKILGGKGGYGNYVGTLSFIDAALVGTVFAPLAVLYILGVLAGAGKMVMALTWIFSFIVLINFAFLHVKATQAVHRISMFRAVVVIIVSLIVTFAILFIRGMLMALLDTT